MPKIRKPRPTTCNVEGCCQPVYAPPSNPYVRQCYEHYLQAKNENRRLRNQGEPKGLERERPDLPDEGYQPTARRPVLQGLKTPGFGL